MPEAACWAGRGARPFSVSQRDAAQSSAGTACSAQRWLQARPCATDHWLGCGCVVWGCQRRKSVWSHLAGVAYSVSASTYGQTRGNQCLGGAAASMPRLMLGNKMPGHAGAGAGDRDGNEADRGQTAHEGLCRRAGKLWHGCLISWTLRRGASVGAAAHPGS